MKVFIIAALTADGFIAESHDQHINWTSPEDKQFYRARTKQAGTMVMGSRTFATIGQALPERQTIVYTSRPESIQMEGVTTTNELPADLVERLAAAGQQELAICGGASIYRLFMAAGVVDELYLTIEPIIFGQGVTLYDQPLVQRLDLLETTKLNKSTILQHYTVSK